MKEKKREAQRVDVILCWAGPRCKKSSREKRREDFAPESVETGTNESKACQREAKGMGMEARGSNEYGYRRRGKLLSGRQAFVFSHH